MKEYFLHTDRTGFGRWTEELLPQALLLWGDPGLTRLIGGAFTEKQIVERLKLEIENDIKFGVQYWPFYLLESGNLIGCCGLRPYRTGEDIYEIGFHVLPDYWRQGFAFEAAVGVISHAFDKLEASGLFAGHHPLNIPSGRLLMKLGFRYSHDEYYPPTGLKHPSYFMSAEAYKGRDLIFDEAALLDKLYKAWSGASSSLWTAGNPAAGQCGVTSCLIYRLFGGRLLKTPLNTGMHFYNEINGLICDFTKSQFDGPIQYLDIPADEAEIFNESTPDQYENLRRRFFDLLK